MAIRKLKKYVPTKFKAKKSVYDKDAADYAVNFIQALCHTKGTWAGKPFELIDWQEQIIRDLFGTINPNGYRQFNTAYIEIAKKEGKSELAAATTMMTLTRKLSLLQPRLSRQSASVISGLTAPEPPTI
jgi:phage terminase large subunit-like protein